MREIKTYGVNGLIEWDTTIQAGKAKLHVIFSGGAMTAYGTTPATYTTKSPLVQNIIEHSDYYKSGWIKLLRSQPCAASADDHQALPGGTVRADNHQALPGGTVRADDHQALPGGTVRADDRQALPDGTVSADDHQALPDGTVGEAAGQESAETKVEVACLDDAKAYLSENYGVRNIRTWADAKNAAAQRGIEFVTQ